MTQQPTPPNPDYAKAVRDNFARQALLGALGAWLTEVAPGRATVELPFSARIALGPGQFHPAVLGTIAEVAAGCAVATLAAADAAVTMLEYKLNLLAPPQGVLLRAQAHVEHAGAGVGVARVEVVCGDGTTMTRCGLLTGTYRIGAASGAT